MAVDYCHVARDEGQFDIGSDVPSFDGYQQHRGPVTAASLVGELFGGLGSQISLQVQHSTADERELIYAVQHPTFKPPPKTTRKPRTELEALDLKISAVGKGPDKDFLSCIARLLKKYKINQPTVQVEFRDLNISTAALKGSAAVPTVGSSFLNLAKSFVCIKPETTEKAILKDINGVLLPGRLTLLLGPPSCGKSSLLKALSGRVVDGPHLKVSGSMTYNGHSFDEFNVVRSSAFVGQIDNHIPQLSVLETLEFAHVCQNGRHAEMFNLVERIEQAVGLAGFTCESMRSCDAACQATAYQDEAQFLELLGELKAARGIRVLTSLRGMGIAHTKDTFVGDAMLRGVSGGERKRVTLGEMMVGNRLTMFLDEISTGLDSATLFSIISSIGRMTRIFQYTSLISLLQPPPEVYNLFDDLMLMSQGQVVWHGPVGDVVPFLSTLGFVCPARKDVPSFLQEVTTQSGQLEYASDELLRKNNLEGRVFPDGRKRFVVPIEDMVAAFWRSAAGKDMTALLDKPFDKARSHPAALKQGRFALTSLEALSVVTQRQWLLLTKDLGLVRGRMIQSVVMGLIVGSLFYQLQPMPQSVSLFFGAAFLMVMFVSMGSMIGLTTAIASKGVWYKHRDNMFYPGWVHSLAVALVQIPVQLVDVALWCIITYFMMGFYPGPAEFFTFYLILVCVSISVGALFRLVGHMAPDGIAANTYGGLTLLIMIVMSGFTIPRPQIPDWWIWAYWISPYSWAMRGVVINEMTAPRWQTPVSNTSSTTIGEAGLQMFGFFPEKSWIWAGVGYLLGAALLFTFMSACALQYVSGPKRIATVADEEELEAAHKEAQARRAANVKKADTEMAPVGEEHVTVDVGEAAASRIPFEKVTLVWRGLRYFVPNPSAGKVSEAPKQLELLKGITGFAEPGELTALMGGSGAGKTTLMDCIAGRKTMGEIQGEISVNGHPKVQETWSRVMGYVEQMDIHTPAQTVIEALLFSARLRLPASTSREEVHSYVDDVLDLVDLTEIMFSLVGTPGVDGLSVEQRKRLTIAIEMVANPSVMFMDEPTSGLDARAAAIVMRTVRNVGNSKRAVLVTIHQPSIEIFETFDNLLLLQRGGRVTYFGPLGHESSQLVAYLQAVPGCPEIHAGANPATWMLEVTGGAVSVTTKAVEVNWPDLYEASELARGNNVHADELILRDSKAKQPLAVSGRYAADFGTQLSALWRKFNSAYWRMPSYNYIRYLTTVLVACIYGSIYYKIADFGSPTDTATVQSVGGVIYLTVSFLGMSNMMAVMPLVGLERVVYYREQAASFYNPWAYGAIISLVEVPYQLVQCCIFICILYPMLFYTRTAEHFFFYLCLTVESLMFYVSFGTALMYLSPSQQLAQISGSGLNFLFNIFNGYVIPYPDMFQGWQWMNRISPTTWVIYGLVTDQLGDREELVEGIPGNPNANVTVSQYIEARFGYQYDFRCWTILILFAYILFFRSVSVLALRYINFLRR